MGRARHRSIIFAAALLMFGLAGCVRLDRTDVFAVESAPLDAATLHGLSDAGHRVSPLKLAGFSAYVDQSVDDKGYLIFFNGSGYGALTAFKALLPRVRPLHLGLVALNYRDTGTPAPSVGAMQKAAAGLYDAVAALPGPASQHVYAAGHSLGVSFALSLASVRRVDGVILFGVNGDPVAQNDYDYLPWSHLLHFEPDPDVMRLDNVRLARSVDARTLIFSSTGDELAPLPFAEQTLAAFPKQAPAKLVVLKGVPHSAYLVTPQVWRDVSRYFGLPDR